MRMFDTAITRRHFLQGGSALAASAALAGLSFAGTASESSPRLVVVILRVDGYGYDQRHSHQNGGQIASHHASLAESARPQFRAAPARSVLHRSRSTR